MIDYLVGERRYGLSYSDLRQTYREFVEMHDADFVRQLSRAAHLACIICWLKELPADATIGDCGIVHELIHLMTTGTTSDLATIRAQFARDLELV